MYPLTELPKTYRRQSTFNLSQNKLVLLSLSVLAAILLCASIWCLTNLIPFLRPNSAALLISENIFTVLPQGGWRMTIPSTWVVGAVLATPLVIVIHEAIHGLFFWLLTGKFSHFGFKGLLVYTATPRGVYLRRNQYLIVGLSPLVILSFIGVLLLLFLPVNALATLICFISFNISGSVGDIAVSVWILQKPANALIEDKGTSLIVYKLADIP